MPPSLPRQATTREIFGLSGILQDTSFSREESEEVLRESPKAKKGRAWLAVCIWALVIFLTIPLARPIINAVSEGLDRAVFMYLVLSIIAIVFVLSLVYLFRNRLFAPARLIWLFLPASVFVAYTIHLSAKSPEEAIHFVQYGVLGLLVFRALSIARPCIITYFSAAVICGIIGTVDEVIQWLVPGRYWGFRDIWLNFFSGALVQVAIAGGLQPAYIARRPALNDIRFLCKLLTAAAVLIGLCLLNTPDRIAWYAERIPGLRYLKENESVMTEYGYLYQDPDIGTFRSRLLPEELERDDRQRAARAAAILNIYKPESAYEDFLSIYTPVNDPFLHEARVHLFSRDKNLFRALELEDNSDDYSRKLTTAFRENQILEKYFTNTLGASDYIWPPGSLALAEKHLMHDEPFESWVSRHLITAVSEFHMLVFFASVILGLSILNGILKKFDSKARI